MTPALLGFVERGFSSPLATPLVAPPLYLAVLGILLRKFARKENHEKTHNRLQPHHPALPREDLMTTTQLLLWAKGRTYWEQYVQLNGYAFSPTKAGLGRLACQIGIRAKELRQAITLYLEN